MIERGHLRIGNDAYTRTNGTYGATSLECRHVRVCGAHVELHYRGRSGIARHIEVDDGPLGGAIARVRAMPGRRLFQYVDDAGRHPLTSSDVNQYLHETSVTSSRRRISAPGRRRYRARLLLAAAEVPTSERASRRAVAAVIREVADRLGHTPAVCRKSYLHPRVLGHFADGGLAAAFPPRLRTRASKHIDVDVDVTHHSAHRSQPAPNSTPTRRRGCGDDAADGDAPVVIVTHRRLPSGLDGRGTAAHITTAVPPAQRTENRS